MKELESYKVIPRPRKGGVLTPSTFGCLEGIPALNVTKGCMFQCTYCYARGYSQVPQKGEIFLYTNLPDILRKEVLRRKIVPQWVILNPNAIKRQNRLACLRVAASAKAGRNLLDIKH